MSIRPRINVTQEEWDIFNSYFPKLETFIQKLAEYKSLGNMDELALAYALYQFIPRQDALYTALFNPDILRHLFPHLEKDCLKFITLAKNKRRTEDVVKWESIRNKPCVYPPINKNDIETFYSTMKWICSQDSSIVQDTEQINSYFVKSYYTLQCLSKWLIQHQITFSYSEINNLQDFNLIWFDYYLTITI